MYEKEYILKILSVLSQETSGDITLKELSEKTGIELGHLKHFLALDFLRGAPVLKFWEIELYDQEGNDVFDKYLDFEDDLSVDNISENLLNDDTIIQTFLEEESDRFKGLLLLSGYERRVLLEILDDLIPKRNSKFSFEDLPEFKRAREELERLNESRVIKNSLKITEGFLSKLVDILKISTKNEKLTIILDNDERYEDMEFENISFDDELNDFYLRACKNGKSTLFRINKIKEIKLTGKPSTGESGKLKYEVVKVRVYDEKNGIRRSLRRLKKYKILEKKDFNGYSDITLLVRDIQIFRRILRELGPVIVVLEPENLRKNMIEDLIKWKEMLES